MDVSTVERNADGQLPAYADGGYPFIYYTESGDTVCNVCASDDDTSDPVKYADIHYEGAPEPCTDCGTEVESAYGDPDANPHALHHGRP